MIQYRSQSGPTDESVLSAECQRRSTTQPDASVNELLETLPPGWPIACLTVHGLTDPRPIWPILARYDLCCCRTHPADTMDLFCMDRRECQHKHQAVRLFVAGIEILLRNRAAGLCLHQINRLRHTLTERMGAPASACWPAKHGWSLPICSGRFGLVPPVNIYLAQAGFLLPSSPHGSDCALELGIAEVHELYRRLINPVEKRDHSSEDLCQAVQEGVSTW